jgi:hypothetical protein
MRSELQINLVVKLLKDRNKKIFILFIIAYKKLLLCRYSEKFALCCLLKNHFLSQVFLFGIRPLRDPLHNI